MTAFKGRDLIAIGDLSREDIRAILDRAAAFDRDRQSIASSEHRSLLNPFVLATLFYEPSTRTRLSFESAMVRLGGKVISVAEAKTSSSAAKGETLADTARTVSAYADVIVIRHSAVGSARELADAAPVPVINAGDGTGEHPTQALLDLYTIERERGRLDGLRIGLVGDLKNGRTVHSLAQALAHWDVSFTFVAPPALRMPADITNALRSRGIEVEETGDLAGAAQVCDVLYVTRIQRERFEDADEYIRLKGSYVVDRALLEQARPGITIMHPLPRVDEIATDVDPLPNAAYFRQLANGVVVRMALLSMVLGAV
jgi:aspartate carbamoyltransferase catalytic subunit